MTAGTSLPATPPGAPLARQARLRFVADLEGAIPGIAEAVREALVLRSAQTGTARDMQAWRDARLDFEKQQNAWVQGTLAAWRRALAASLGRPPSPAAADSQPLELIVDAVIERQILAARMARSLADHASRELAELRVRMREAEGDAELSEGDLLLPEVVAGIMVEQWDTVGLTRDGWALAQDAMGPRLAAALEAAYDRTNAFLAQAGVLRQVPLRVRRTEGGASTGASTADAAPAARGAGAATGPQQLAGALAATPRAEPAASGLQRLPETLRQLLRRHLPESESNRPAAVSALLASALARAAVQSAEEPVAAAGDDGSAAVPLQQATDAVRRRSDVLRQQASSASERATIEIVALMFQSILAEERIPAAVRVLFARLQIPVLRVAVSEPAFFGTLQHPARQLIDRMGACALGFDAQTIRDGALAHEIRRVVQTIEQFPETGSRVFVLMGEEFRAFLARHLTGGAAATRLVTLAQQVEQKETLAVRYTIELRGLLQDLPVPTAIRDFLFKVWAEALAVACVRQGPQHTETRALQRAAADMVWAAGAKPQRAERSRVLQQLPQLLQRLRQGMTLLGLDDAAQEAHVRTISAALGEAFLAKTEAIAPTRIEAMATRLAQLEATLPPGDDDFDLALNARDVEQLLDLDSAAITVLANRDDGLGPPPAALARARTLAAGSWFTLHSDGPPQPVRLTWRSPRGQLQLFGAAGDHSYLFQTRRLAAFLQAGLLVPREEEALTVRATRDALARLEAGAVQRDFDQTPTASIKT